MKNNNMTNEELDLVHFFKSILKDHKGKDDAITSIELMERAFKAGHWMNGGAQLRKIINYIRVNRLVKNLVASSKGYYISQSKVEVRMYVSSLRARANEILKVSKSYNV